MHRNLPKLTEQLYDLLIIGGGVYGACIAWDACLRGLSVALVEKGDFGSATSANSLKVIHGGLRYLQHGDFHRMRQSISERKALLRIAPHLIHPLPVLVPTYGHGLKGREALSLALKINDLVSCDRNLQIANPQKQIPNGRILSRQDCLNLLPGIPREGLTGGAVFYDAQVYNSERLLMAFLQSASLQGADVANYVEAIGLLSASGKITGATVKDGLTGDTFDIQAKTVVNASGPWVSRSLKRLKIASPLQQRPLAKAMNVVTRSLFDHPYAVGISSRKPYRDPDALINKGGRLFFVAPWRQQSLVGTVYSPYTDDPDALSVTESEIAAFLHDVNAAYPPAKLTLDDVRFVHRGLLPSSGICPKSGDVQLAKHYELYNHRQDGISGLLSVIGVKYTTARGVAQRVVDQVFRLQGKRPPVSRSATQPLHGGRIDQFDAFLQAARQTQSPNLSEATVRRLVYSYGSAYREVLAHLDEPTGAAGEPLDNLAVLKAEVRYGVHAEMAQKLSDVVLRRTELGSAGRPKDDDLQTCAETMGQVLNWSLAKIQAELEETSAYFKNQLPRNVISIR